jgi:ABC-2 type transport system permease protein
MSDQISTPAAEAPTAAAPIAKVRPLYWSVRRELWENNSVYLAPLVVAGLALLGFLISSFHLARDVRGAEAMQAAARAAPDNAQIAKALSHAHAALQQPYDFVIGAVFATSVVVTIFYCLAALYNERRDRSVLFWKSLPVSDLTTVLSKVAVAFVASPVVVLAVALGAYLLMLSLSSFVLLANGLSPAAYFSYLLPFPMMWLALARGLLVMVLWYAPVMAWLILVSGWARRVAILWALGPWAAACIFEILAFHSQNIWIFVRHRLAGGMAWAFNVHGQGDEQIHTLAGLDLTPVLTSPEVLGGVVAAVALIAGAVRQRRYRDPI